ncbi:MAG: LD-carboxypeptidase [Defluviitaleaceae bacterium]|nr:LD-carboxypeptidase [Defluviitaleaceae bacterium]
MKMPKLLRQGDTVAIIATSGPCDPERLDTGLEIIKAMGLVPWVMESCRSRHGFLAGTDDIRLKDLHTAFAAPDVRGIFVARGGYGAARLLPYIDFDLIRNNPKVFVGYSDVTALHIAINQRCGFITFHGPMSAVDFSKEIHPLTLESFKRMIFEGIAPPLSGVTIIPGRARGPLTGGNLSLLTASIGTPFELDTRGKILFIEEIDEEPYSVDRMLLQLKHAGKFKDAAGILLGDFTPQTLETLHISINELIIPEKKPTLAGLACGHTSPNFTLPLGATVELISDLPFGIRFLLYPSK